MRKIILLCCLIYPFLLLAQNKEDSQKNKNDSINSYNKIITHGVYIEFFGKKKYYYSIGYEYRVSKGINSGGCSFGIGINPLKVNGINKQILITSSHVDLGGFYDLGKQFGMRVGLFFNYDFNPDLFSNKLNNSVLYADLPFIQMFYSTPIIGIYYRTKNNRWQFGLNGVTYIMLGYQRYYQNFSKSWLSKLDYMTSFFGISLKYNFKIKQK